METKVTQLDQEFIKELHTMQGSIARYTGYKAVTEGYSYVWYPQDPDELSQLSYGDLKTYPKVTDPQPNDFFMHDYCSGSDYSGSLVEVSNHAVMLEKFAGLPGVKDVYGGHGTFAIAIQLSTLQEARNHALGQVAHISEEAEDRAQVYISLWETLNALDDYPLIDDEDHSRRESEGEDEAWSDWAAHDYASLLEKKFDVEDLDPQDERLFNLFRSVCESANEYWINEEGSSMWIDVERIADATTLESFEAMQEAMQGE